MSSERSALTSVTRSSRRSSRAAFAWQKPHPTECRSRLMTLPPPVPVRTAVWPRNSCRATALKRRWPSPGLETDMPVRRGLGKGLEALIPSGQTLGGVEQGAIEALLPNPRQPRTSFDQTELDQRAAPIREHGVRQPLIVTPEPNRDEFRLIAGERRLQAARMAGLHAVPVIVRSVSDQQRIELALIENLQRADLNPLAAAEGYRQLTQDFKLAHEEAAAGVGKTRTSVTNTPRLLKLGTQARQALAAGSISEGHARALLGLPMAQSQTAALGGILSRGLNVRQTEALVRRLVGGRR